MKKSYPTPTNTCIFCNGQLQHAFDSADYNRRLSAQRFTYFRCTECDSYALADVPADLTTYYPANYYSLPRNVAEADLSTSGEEYKLEVVRRYVRGGRLLEIGPGAGMFAHLCARRGFEVETIEMSSRSAEFIQDVLGIRTHRTDDEVATLSKCGNFNVIAMWHVIEHVKEPVALLHAAAEKLSPGGILIIATPNPGSVQFKLLRGRWVHVDAPRHLHLISTKALRANASQCALKSDFITTSDEGAKYWNRFGWECSFRNQFENATLARAAAFVGRLTSRLMSRVESVKGKGSAYTLVLVKE